MFAYTQPKIPFLKWSTAVHSVFLSLQKFPIHPAPSGIGSGSSAFGNNFPIDFTQLMIAVWWTPFHRSIALNPIAQRGVSHFRSHRLPGIPVLSCHIRTFGSVISL